MRNQDKKYTFISVDEDIALARFYGYMNTCHNINIIVQTTGGDASYLNGKSETPNKTLANITRALLLNSSQNKEPWCFAYQYFLWLSIRTTNIMRNDVPYFLFN